MFKSFNNQKNMSNDSNSKNKTYKSKIVLFSRYDQQSLHLNSVLRFGAKIYIFFKKKEKKRQNRCFFSYIHIYTVFFKKSNLPLDGFFTFSERWKIWHLTTLCNSIFCDYFFLSKILRKNWFSKKKILKFWNWVYIFQCNFGVWEN